MQVEVEQFKKATRNQPNILKVSNGSHLKLQAALGDLPAPAFSTDPPQLTLPGINFAAVDHFYVVFFQ